MVSKVVSFKVGLEDWQAYERFARRQGIQPYKVFRMMVMAWAGAERLARLMEGGGSPLDTLGEFARLTQEIKAIFKLNGEMAAVVKLLAERHGLHFDLEELWKRYEESPQGG